MHRATALIPILVAVALGIAACGREPPARAAAHAAESGYDPAIARRIIEENNARFTRAHVTGDRATIDAMFTADARSLPPGSLPVLGREAISRLTAEYLAAGVAEFTETTTDFYGDGDVLIDQGDYVMVYGKERTRETGKYLNVWTREDGTWKIRTNIWNTNPSPAPGP